MVTYGPQGEVIEDRDVAVDGPGFTTGPQGERIRPDSVFASGTDRESPDDDEDDDEDGYKQIADGEFGESVNSQPGSDLDARPGATPSYNGVQIIDGKEVHDLGAGHFLISKEPVHSLIVERCRSLIAIRDRLSELYA